MKCLTLINLGSCCRISACVRERLCSSEDQPAPPTRREVAVRGQDRGQCVQRRLLAGERGSAHAGD